MSAHLPGLRIGPLDPDRGENFAQIGGQSTARRLIRHHVAMHPPALMRALNRSRQDERSEAVDREEAEELIRDLYREAGEPLPEDSQIKGFAVRGDDEAPDEQVLTFTFTTKSGRTGKGFVPYAHDELSRTRAAGDEAVRIAKLKEAGLPWAPSEAALAAAGIRGSGVGRPADLDDEDAGALEEAEAAIAAAARERDEAVSDRDALRSELDELRERLAKIEGPAASDAQPSPQTPEGGSPDTVEDRQVPEEPWEDYEAAKAQDVRARIRESRDPALARAVLAWETRPDGGQNRSTVTAAANEVLDHSAAPGGE